MYIYIHIIYILLNVREDNFGLNKWHYYYVFLCQFQISGINGLYRSCLRKMPIYHLPAISILSLTLEYKWRSHVHCTVMYITLFVLFVILLLQCINQSHNSRFIALQIALPKQYRLFFKRAPEFSPVIWNQHLVIRLTFCRRRIEGDLREKEQCIQAHILWGNQLAKVSPTAQNRR